MKVLAVLLCSFPLAQAATINDLQRTADCVAALHIAAAEFQMRGDYPREQGIRRWLSIEFDRFYDELERHTKIYPSAQTEFLGQMPNRALQKYLSMGDRAQIKYATSVMSTNNCGYKPQ